MKQIQRIISFLLAVVLAFGMVPPVAVRAESMLSAEESLEETTVQLTEETTVAEETVCETIGETEETLEPAQSVTVPLEVETEPTQEEIPAAEVEPQEAETEPAEQTGAFLDPVEQSMPPMEPETEELTIEQADGAAALTGNGTCGTNVTWSLQDGTLTISGSGEMSSYSSGSTAPWFSERLNIRSVVVESGVTSVGSYAFYYCTNLESV